MSNREQSEGRSAYLESTEMLTSMQHLRKVAQAKVQEFGVHYYGQPTEAPSAEISSIGRSVEHFGDIDYLIIDGSIGAYEGLDGPIRLGLKLYGDGSPFMFETDLDREEKGYYDLIIPSDQPPFIGFFEFDGDISVNGYFDRLQRGEEHPFYLNEGACREVADWLEEPRMINRVLEKHFN